MSLSREFISNRIYKGEVIGEERRWKVKTRVDRTVKRLISTFRSTSLGWVGEMAKSAVGVVEDAETFTGVIRRLIICRPRIKRKSYAVTQWENGAPGFEGFA